MNNLSMLRLLKSFLCVGLVVAGARSASGFALLGPFDTWQVAALTYRVGGDIGGPQNLGEEYRRVAPVLYYAFDANFLDYFGTKGVTAVEQAITIFNAVRPVSSYSKDLTEFPLEAYGENYTAEALTLTDLKSVTMNVLLEELGLAESDRYTWCLHDRLVGPPPGCPINMFYTVIMRNFDPATLNPTPYVNGTLYTYVIEEFCTGTPFLSDAAEVNVDPLANNFTAVSSRGFNEFDTLGNGLSVFDVGHYFTGLTRDDVGGLRYLLKTNNMNTETAGPGTLVYTTNRTPQLLYTSNLNLLAAAALTNDAATLQALYPGLVVADTGVSFTNVWVATLSSYLTNYPFDPVGTPPHTVFVTNYTLVAETLYDHTFANVYSVQRTPTGFNLVQITNPKFWTAPTYVTVQTTTVKQSPFAPAGSGALVTNTSTATYYSNTVVGEYFFLPTNSCDVAILYPQITNVVFYTNILSITTNATVVTTNGVSGTNGNVTTVSVISHATTHAYVVKPIICESNSIALRQGIEHVQFIRRDFDSLLGQFYNSITNFYTLNAVTNNTILKQRVRRLVSVPDVLFTAQDLATTTADPLIGATLGLRTADFINHPANTYIGLNGPGIIAGAAGLGTQITFNKVGPIYLVPGFLTTTNQFTEYGEADAITVLIWGSYDGRTNYPTIYPEGTSIDDLASQVLIYASIPALPAGQVGVPYTYPDGQPVRFGVSGGSAPYTFDFIIDSSMTGPPPGLTLDPRTGIISGTPTTPGEYTFALVITDAGMRSSQWNYAIMINP
jgi:hypothetical protein